MSSEQKGMIGFSVGQIVVIIVISLLVSLAVMKFAGGSIIGGDLLQGRLNADGGLVDWDWVPPTNL